MEKSGEVELSRLGIGRGDVFREKTTFYNSSII
jgi:hypothetical protein